MGCKKRKTPSIVRGARATARPTDLFGEEMGKSSRDKLIHIYLYIFIYTYVYIYIYICIYQTCDMISRKISPYFPQIGQRL